MSGSITDNRLRYYIPLDGLSPFPEEFLKTTPGTQVMFTLGPPRADSPKLCDTFWGTHGCQKPRGHLGSWHLCDCGHWVLQPTVIPAHLADDVKTLDVGTDADGFVWQLFHLH
jgi:hypothetical protein